MGRPSIRGDSGYSAPGQFTFIPAATTDPVGVAIPRVCRYFKISASTRIWAQLRLDLAATTFWAQQGTNIEDVGWLFNSNALSTLVLSFLG
ncbi:hypothetical protein LCGC14_1718350 [marine sediment metagenome]|uniref:Uncharacterized protein n=1 Tax=marine sediment metagenome TaxID=412755 RepID=A0A0F9KD08_9ZZZZ